jgi:6-methylsalicylate decarboxylase
VRVDVHAHHFPAEYIQCLDRFGNSHAARLAGTPGAAMPLDERADLLTSVGIDRQVLGLGAAGPYLPRVEDATAAARLGNDVYADVCRGFGGRYLALGSVPLPHVDAAVAETARCLDELGFLGMTVGCSVGERQLDAPEFTPFWAELDRRGAVLVLHPVGASFGPACGDYGLTWMIGAPFEDTVATLRLVLSGLTTRYPNVRLVVPHLGGTLPFLLQRLDDQTDRSRAAGETQPIAEYPSALVRRLWYDTVNQHPAALRCACESFGAERLLLGTDFPYLMGPKLRRCVSYVEEAGLGAAETAGILGDNARALLGIAA